MSAARFSWQSALARAVIGVFGGFLLAICFMVGSTALCVAAGWLTRTDGVLIFGMLAFLIWATAVLLAFGAQTVKRAALLVLGSSAGFALLGWLCA